MIVIAPDRPVHPLALQALEDRLHLRDGYEVVLAPSPRPSNRHISTLTPSISNYPLDSAVRRHIVDRDPSAARPQLRRPQPRQR